MAGSKIDFTRGTSPGNPASGKLRLWADDSTGKLEALDSAGGNAFPTVQASGPTIFDGSSYYLPHLMKAITPAATAGFSWGNQNGATETANGPAVTLSQQSTATDQFNMRYVAAPGSDFTVITASYVIPSSSFAGAGICMHESASGKVLAYVLSPTWANGIIRASSSDITGTQAQTGLGSSPFIYLLEQYSMAGLVWIWLKMARSGANIVSSVSHDGTNWVQIESVATASYFTTAPDRGGYVIRPSGDHVVSVLAHFSQSTP